MIIVTAVSIRYCAEKYCDTTLYRFFLTPLVQLDVRKCVRVCVCV